MTTDKNSEMRITQEYINAISYKIVGCAIEVNKHFGPKLLAVYECCFLEEFRQRN